MNNDAQCDRRDFLRLGMTTTIALAATNAFPTFSWADVNQIHLDECLSMTPQQMAKKSKLVQDSWNYLQTTVATITDSELRQSILTMINNPVPTFLKPLSSGYKNTVYRELKGKGLLDAKVSEADFLPAIKDIHTPPQPFFSAPGSGYTSHHAYPGGVCTHTALNLKSSLSLWENYQKTFGITLDRNLVIASQMLHDLHKGWVFQWQANGTSRDELPLAGTGEHHVYSIAESIVRKLPAPVCVAQACAHNHPGSPDDEKQVVAWLQAASILAGVDPIGHGLLAADGATLPVPRRMEDFVCHLGDHDWVLAAPAVKWLLPEMQAIAGSTYKMSNTAINGKEFNLFRNYVFSQATVMALYHEFSLNGRRGLQTKIAEIVKPA